MCPSPLSESCHSSTVTGHADPGTDTRTEPMAGGGSYVPTSLSGTNVTIEDLHRESHPASRAPCEDVSRTTTRVKEETVPIAQRSSRPSSPGSEGVSS